MHTRYKAKGKFATKTEHYPPEHQAYAEEDIMKVQQWSKSVGVETTQLIAELLSGPHPLRHLRRSQGILHLSVKYSKLQLEKACAVANRFNNKTISYIERVILNGSFAEQNLKGGEAIQRSYNPNLRGIKAIIH